jgi:hypothetical protein
MYERIDHAHGHNDHTKEENSKKMSKHAVDEDGDDDDDKDSCLPYLSIVDDDRQRRTDKPVHWQTYVQTTNDVHSAIHTDNK